METSGRTSIWLDCDTGHDGCGFCIAHSFDLRTAKDPDKYPKDALAILLAAHHPKARLIGVSTVHGNAPVEHTTANTRAILDAIGCYNIPVVKGEAEPPSRSPLHAPQFHGENGLGGVTLLPEPKLAERDEVKLGMHEVCKLLMEEPEDSVWIVPTGPLTNIAKLIKEYPRVLTRVRGVSAMGGAIGDNFSDSPAHRPDGPGNFTQFAEFNIICDPEAAQFVLSNRSLADKTLATLDLTHHCRATQQVVDRLSGASTLRRMFLEILTFFAETYKIHAGIADGPPMHDPVAVFAVLEPEKFDDRNGERWDVQVEMFEEMFGRTTITPSDSSKSSMQIRVPRSLDVASFWSAIEECLSSAELASNLG